MPDKLNVKVSNTKMNEAFWSWCEIPVVKDEAHWMEFWLYVGEYTGPTHETWFFTENGARKINYLLSPYAPTIVQAWFRKYGDR